MISHEGAIYPSMWERSAPYLAEYIGVFILTMTFSFNYSHSMRESDVWGANSNAMMVMALTYALMHVSGANLNPSVSIVLTLTGRHSPWVVLRLCFAQLLGAASAAIVQSQFSTQPVEFGALKGHTVCAAAFVELIYTAMLCFVYLNCVASVRNNPVAAQNGFAGLAVGFCFVAGAYAARSVSRTVMNSAIALGLGLVGLHNHQKDFWFNGVVFFFADLAGAFVGAGLYRVVRPEEMNTSFSVVRADRKSDRDSAKVAAEFIGTFYLIITKALNRLGSTGVGPEAWSVAAAMVSMVYSLRGVSGGYFNPAVTIAAVASGRSACSWRVAIFYIAAQVLAAVAASSVFAAMSGGQRFQHRPTMEVSSNFKFFCEGTFTGLLAYVVLAMAVDPGLPAPAREDKALGPPRLNNIAGFAYGACHTAGGFSIGHITGSLMNPAIVVSFTGIDIFRGHLSGNELLYIIYQVVGALVGAGFFMVTHVRLYRKDEHCLDDAKGEARQGTAA